MSMPDFHNSLMDDLSPTCYEAMLADPTGSVVQKLIDACEAHRTQLAAARCRADACPDLARTMDSALSSAIDLLRDIHALHIQDTLR
jgi:hypothetical protein